jgi:DNA-binding HxlR family transcriptional regulator
MEQKPKVVTDESEVVKELVAEQEDSRRRTVKYRVRNYISCKQTLDKKLKDVVSAGKVYRDILSGDFEAKMVRVMAKLKELGVSDIESMTEKKQWGMDVNVFGKLAGKKALIFVNSKRWGPEVYVYLTRPNREYGQDLALHIKFGSKNMIVQNKLLDIAVNDRG